MNLCFRADLPCRIPIAEIDFDGLFPLGFKRVHCLDGMRGEESKNDQRCTKRRVGCHRQVLGFANYGHDPRERPF